MFGSTYRVQGDCSSSPARRQALTFVYTSCTLEEKENTRSMRSRSDKSTSADSSKKITLRQKSTRNKSKSHEDQDVNEKSKLDESDSNEKQEKTRERDKTSPLRSPQASRRKASRISDTKGQLVSDKGIREVTVDLKDINRSYRHRRLYSLLAL